jgi:hypothetical protein
MLSRDALFDDLLEAADQWVRTDFHAHDGAGRGCRERGQVGVARKQRFQQGGANVRVNQNFRTRWPRGPGLGSLQSLAIATLS